MSHSLTAEVPMLSKYDASLSSTLTLLEDAQPGACVSTGLRECLPQHEFGPAGLANWSRVQQCSRGKGLPLHCKSPPTLLVLKVARTGSTWLAKELRGFPGFHVEFEPFTDPEVPPCAGDFYTAATRRATRTRLRCLTAAARAKSCYWANLQCDATQLQPRPPNPTEATLLLGILVNPKYMPGCDWAALALGANAPKIVLLRRSNLVKMAVSEITRITARRARAKQSLQLKSGEHDGAAHIGENGVHAAANRSTLQPEHLLRTVQFVLREQSYVPSGVPLHRAMLVLYEDLQLHRADVLSALLGFIGIARVPVVARELARQQGQSARSTHWRKASEALCSELSPTLCAAIRSAFVSRHPCLHAQLESTSVAAWSFPSTAGRLTFDATGECAPLQLLSERACPRRSFLELFGHAHAPARAHAHAHASSHADKPKATQAGQRDEACTLPSASDVPQVLFREVDIQSSKFASEDAASAPVKDSHAASATMQLQDSKQARARERPRQLSRFIILTRQRSASTTFVHLLNLHPEVASRWELFSGSYTAANMRAWLGVHNRSEQQAHVSAFADSFWQLCERTPRLRSCGFKLMPGHIRPPERLKELFGATDSLNRRGQGNGDAPRLAQTSFERSRTAYGPPLRILLERGNVTAEFRSWRRALLQGNWGTSPILQQRIAGAHSRETNGPFSNAGTPINTNRTGCRGCSAEAAARNSAIVKATPFPKFLRQHRAWFATAKALASLDESPLLHLFSENLTASREVCNATMARAFRFLRVTPMAENCDMNRVQLEWPCDIANDKRCSMDKFILNGKDVLDDVTR